MDTSTTIYIIAGTVLAGFLVLAILKGIIKMILFGVGVLGAFLAYYWISRHGYTYLSFITSDPREWMVTTFSWLSAVFVFSVFTHGMFWFSNVFSLGSKMGFGGFKGILTTILMVLVLCWAGVLAVFYYGDVADIKQAHQAALAQSGGKNEAVATAWVYDWKKQICSHESTQWLMKLDPMKDSGRVSLAKIIAYLSTFEHDPAAGKYGQIAPYIPRPRRLWTLCRDAGIRAMVERQDMAGLMNHPELTKFLSDPSSRDAVLRFPVDQFIAQMFPSVQGGKALPLQIVRPETGNQPSGAVPPPDKTVNPISKPVRVAQ